MQNCTIHDAVNTLRLYAEIKRSNEKIDKIIQKIKNMKKDTMRCPRCCGTGRNFLVFVCFQCEGRGVYTQEHEESKEGFYASENSVVDCNGINLNDYYRNKGTF